MTDTSIAISPSPSLPAPQQEKKKTRGPSISAPLRRACELLASGQCQTIKAAAMRVGLSREHLSKSLAKPHVQVFIAQRAQQTISRGILRASNRFIELIDAESEHVGMKVSDRILVHAGVIKPEQTHGGVNVSVGIQNNVSPGYVIDLSEPAPQQIEAHAKRGHDVDD